MVPKQSRLKYPYGRYPNCQPHKGSENETATTSHHGYTELKALSILLSMSSHPAYHRHAYTSSQICGTDSSSFVVDCPAVIRGGCGAVRLARSKAGVG
jgi:hypothetical protein